MGLFQRRTVVVHLTFHARGMYHFLVSFMWKNYDYMDYNQFKIISAFCTWCQALIESLLLFITNQVQNHESHLLKFNCGKNAAACRDLWHGVNAWWMWFDWINCKEKVFCSFVCSWLFAVNVVSRGWGAASAKPLHWNCESIISLVTVLASFPSDIFLVQG